MSAASEQSVDYELGWSPTSEGRRLAAIEAWVVETFGDDVPPRLADVLWSVEPGPACTRCGTALRTNAQGLVTCDTDKCPGRLRSEPEHDPVSTESVAGQETPQQLAGAEER